MIKYKWRANSNCFCTVDKEKAKKLARNGEHVSPNPFYRKRTEAEMAENKLKADREVLDRLGRI